MGCVRETPSKKSRQHGMCKRNSPHKNEGSMGWVRDLSSPHKNSRHGMCARNSPHKMMCKRKSPDKNETSMACVGESQLIKIKACMGCVRESVCRSGDSTPADHVPCPHVDGTSSQWKRLQELLTKHAAGFIKDKQDLGYTEAVHHRLRTAGSIPVAQPYRRLPPHQL